MCPCAHWRIQHYCKIHDGEHSKKSIKLFDNVLLMISSEKFAVYAVGAIKTLVSFQRRILRYGEIMRHMLNDTGFLPRTMLAIGMMSIIPKQIAPAAEKQKTMYIYSYKVSPDEFSHFNGNLCFKLINAKLDISDYNNKLSSKMIPS